MKVDFPDYPIIRWEAQPSEFVIPSESGVGAVTSRRFAHGGVFVGYLDFIDLWAGDVDNAHRDELQSWFVRMQDTNSRDLPYTEISINETDAEGELLDWSLRMASPAAGVSALVSGQTERRGELVTTLKTPLAQLQVGHRMNAQTKPVKLVEVKHRIDNTQFVFSPNHVFAEDTQIIAPTKLVVRAQGLGGSGQTIVHTQAERQTIIRFLFVEATQALLE